MRDWLTGREILSILQSDSGKNSSLIGSTFMGAITEDKYLRWKRRRLC